MPMADMLLQIDSYPDPTPVEALDQAVAFAVLAGATLSALAVQIDLVLRSNPVADHLIGLSRLAGAEEGRSLQACHAGLTAFSARAREAGVLGEALIGKADLHLIGEYVAGYARTRDLCLIPVAGPLDGQRSIAEAVVFDSGRPVLLYRPGGADLPMGELGVVVVAWDGSRAAARALADALPLLPQAREVRLLTVTNDKAAAGPGIGQDAARHLRAHGVTVVVDEEDAGGRRTGAVLEAYAAAHGADLMVMGAYGRSRVREFILGGATEHMLHDPGVALLLSH